MWGYFSVAMLRSVVAIKGYFGTCFEVEVGLRETDLCWVLGRLEEAGEHALFLFQQPGLNIFS